MQAKQVILFDLGNVLMEWSQKTLLDRIFSASGVDDTPQIRGYFKTWNEEWDRGHMGDRIAVTRAAFPQHAALMDAYYSRWDETLGQPIAGNVDILRDLKTSGQYRIYAASNWASDTFERAKPRMPFLDYFDGMQISGHVQLIKPEAAFFERMMDVFGFTAAEALFIDDIEDNVAAARKLGIESIRFDNSEQLRRDLEARGILSAA